MLSIHDCNTREEPQPYKKGPNGLLKHLKAKLAEVLSRVRYVSVHTTLSVERAPSSGVEKLRK